MHRPICLFLFSLLFIACTNNETANNPLLAETGENKLYLDDIDRFIPQSINNQKDSLIYINQAIESWVRNQLILEKISLSDKDQNEIEALVQDYSSSLKRARFEEVWLKENIDTTVSQNDINNFILNNESIFKTEGAWIKCQFAKINSQVPEITDFEKKWRKEKKDEVQAFCDKFADLKHLDKDVWVTRNSIESLIPKRSFKEGTFDIKGYSQRSHKGFEYFLTIYKLKKGGSLPEALKKQKAKKIIIQNRKLSLLKKYREDLYHQALKEKRIKFYLDKVI